MFLYKLTNIVCAQILDYLKINLSFMASVEVSVNKTIVREDVYIYFYHTPDYTVQCVNCFILTVAYSLLVRTLSLCLLEPIQKIYRLPCQK